MKNLAKHFLKNALDWMGLRLVRKACLPTFTDSRVFDFMIEHGRKNLTIFDVGANVGQTAMAFTESFPDATVFSFEPFEENFRELEKRAAKNPRIKAFHLALADSSEAAAVFRDRRSFSQWNSLNPVVQQSHKENPNYLREIITKCTGDDFCAESGVGCIDILKTDTEGFDLEVMKGFSKMLKSRSIRAVVSEVGFHQEPSHTDWYGFSEYLFSHGFRCRGIYDVAYHPSGVCQYANAVFAQQPAVTPHHESPSEPLPSQKT